MPAWRSDQLPRLSAFSAHFSPERAKDRGLWPDPPRPRAANSRSLRRARACADASRRGLANLGGRGDQRRCRRGHRARSGPSGCAEATCSSLLTAATPAQGHARSGAAPRPGRARGQARTRQTRRDARPRSRSYNRWGRRRPLLRLMDPNLAEVGVVHLLPRGRANPDARRIGWLSRCTGLFVELPP